MLGAWSEVQVAQQSLSNLQDTTANTGNCCKTAAATSAVDATRLMRVNGYLPPVTECRHGTVVALFVAHQGLLLPTFVHSTAGTNICAVWPRPNALQRLLEPAIDDVAQHGP